VSINDEQIVALPRSLLPPTAYLRIVDFSPLTFKYGSHMSEQMKTILM
jgi:hypothetical protein